MGVLACLLLAEAYPVISVRQLLLVVSDFLVFTLGRFVHPVVSLACLCE